MKVSLWLKIVFFVVVFFSTFAFYSRIVFGASVTLPLDNAGINIFSNASNTFNSAPFSWSNFSVLGPALYDQINNQLYNSFGYDIEDALWTMEDNFTDYATGRAENPINNGLLSADTTNWMASKMVQGIYTADAFVDAGYKYFSNSCEQWGENVKNFVVGKVDEVSGAITDVSSTVIQKITDDGILNLSNIQNNLVSNNQILDLSVGDIFYGRSFALDVFKPDGTSIGQLNINFPFDVGLFIESNSSLDNGLSYIRFIYPEGLGLGNPLFASGVIVSNGNATQFSRIFSTSSYSNYSWNGYQWYAYRFNTSNTGSAYNSLCVRSSDVPTIDAISSLFNSSFMGADTSYIYAYDNSSALALQSQLDRLLGHWVDSLTIGNIQDLLNGGIVINVDGTPSIAFTDEQIAELTDIIDGAIADSINYDDVFGTYYDDAIDDPVIPDPPINDPDIYDEIDVPITPIDTIGSALTVPYMFSSIFEPIFLAFGGGLFSLWLFVPTLIVFVAIIWAMK